MIDPVPISASSNMNFVTWLQSIQTAYTQELTITINLIDDSASISGSTDETMQISAR
jgi:hypothetical protein